MLFIMYPWYKKVLKNAEKKGKLDEKLKKKSSKKPGAIAWRSTPCFLSPLL